MQRVRAVVGVVLFTLCLGAGTSRSLGQQLAEVQKMTKPRPKVIFFDVNETLLDLKSMQDSVGAALGGRKDLLPLWFLTMLHSSLVDTSTGKYHDFATIGTAA